MSEHQHTAAPRSAEDPDAATGTAPGAGSAGPSRRRAVGVGGAAAVGAVALSACGGGGEKAEDTASPTGPAAPTDVAAAADVPVGSGISVDKDGVQAVVAQPTEGTFTAYSPVCPHQGCSVNPAKKQFVCPCHSSVFDLATGDVTGGPASTGLTPYPVKVEKGRVIVG